MNIRKKTLSALMTMQSRQSGELLEGDYYRHRTMDQLRQLGDPKTGADTIAKRTEKVGGIGYLYLFLGSAPDPAFVDFTYKTFSMIGPFKVIPDTEAPIEGGLPTKFFVRSYHPSKESRKALRDAYKEHLQGKKEDSNKQRSDSLKAHHEEKKNQDEAHAALDMEKSAQAAMRIGVTGEVITVKDPLSGDTVVPERSRGGPKVPHHAATTRAATVGLKVADVHMGENGALDQVKFTDQYGKPLYLDMQILAFVSSNEYKFDSLDKVDMAEKLIAIQALPHVRKLLLTKYAIWAKENKAKPGFSMANDRVGLMFNAIRKQAEVLDANNKDVESRLRSALMKAIAYEKFQKDQHGTKDIEEPNTGETPAGPTESKLRAEMKELTLNAGDPVHVSVGKIEKTDEKLTQAITSGIQAGLFNSMLDMPEFILTLRNGQRAKFRFRAQGAHYILEENTAFNARQQQDDTDEYPENVWREVQPSVKDGKITSNMYEDVVRAIAHTFAPAHVKDILVGSNEATYALTHRFNLKLMHTPGSSSGKLPSNVVDGFVALVASIGTDKLSDYFTAGAMDAGANHLVGAISRQQQKAVEAKTAAFLDDPATHLKILGAAMGKNGEGYDKAKALSAELSVAYAEAKKRGVPLSKILTDEQLRVVQNYLDIIAASKQAAEIKPVDASRSDVESALAGEGVMDEQGMLIHGEAPPVSAIHKQTLQDIHEEMAEMREEMNAIRKSHVEPIIGGLERDVVKPLAGISTTDTNAAYYVNAEGKSVAVPSMLGRYTAASDAATHTVVNVLKRMAMGAMFLNIPTSGGPGPAEVTTRWGKFGAATGAVLNPVKARWNNIITATHNFVKNWVTWGNAFTKMHISNFVQNALWDGGMRIVKDATLAMGTLHAIYKNPMWIPMQAVGALVSASKKAALAFVKFFAKDFIDKVVGTDNTILRMVGYNVWDEGMALAGADTRIERGGAPADFGDYFVRVWDEVWQPPGKEVIAKVAAIASPAVAATPGQPAAAAPADAAASKREEVEELRKHFRFVTGNDDENYALGANKPIKFSAYKKGAYSVVMEWAFDPLQENPIGRGAITPKKMRDFLKQHSHIVPQKLYRESDKTVRDIDVVAAVTNAPDDAFQIDTTLNQYRVTLPIRGKNNPHRLVKLDKVAGDPSEDEFFHGTPFAIVARKPGDAD